MVCNLEKLESFLGYKVRILKLKWAPSGVGVNNCYCAGVGVAVSMGSFVKTQTWVYKFHCRPAVQKIHICRNSFVLLLLNLLFVTTNYSKAAMLFLKILILKIYFILIESESSLLNVIKMKILCAVKSRAGSGLIIFFFLIKIL